MSYDLGIDLGTSFVAAAVAREDKVSMVALGDRSVLMPSVVHVRCDGSLVTGEPAARRLVSNPDRVVSQIKRRLGDPTPWVIGGAAYPVTDLLGALLRDVLDRVAAEEGGPPAGLMLTHPANWGPYQQELFAEVPRIAGAQHWRTVTEPEAAAAHYAATRSLAVGEVVAVYDLGGGTFDATVLGRTENGIEVLGTPQGIERLGGADLDEAILSFVNCATGGALAGLDMGDPSTLVALARLRQDCVLAKEALSLDTEATIPVSLPGRHLEVELDRPRFESLIRSSVESTIGALGRALSSASVSPDRLAAVLLVGGSARIPLIPRMLEEQFGCRTVVDAHPKHAVALGAAALSRRAASGQPVAPRAARSGPRAASGGAHDPESSPATATPGGPRRWPVVAASLLLLGGAAAGAVGVGLSHSPAGAQHQQPGGVASAGPSTPAPTTITRSTALPTDVPGLITAVSADPTLAGDRTQPLVTQLGAVAAGAGEARRQAALAALGTVQDAGVRTELAAAVTTVVSPLTVLNTPADLIADLQPDPAPGGPKAVYLLQCMREFLGRSQQQQQAESQEILRSLPSWTAGGGLRADLADATARMVTPVAQGQKVFSDAEAAGGTPAPGG